MDDNEIAKTKAELKELQDRIIAAKRELSKLNKEKEEWFSKRAEIGSQIASQIRDVKEKRAKRDELTEKVQEEKKERRNYSQEIRDKISEVKALREQRRKALEDAGVDARPGNLQRDIERLEFKLETEPMPYNEERRATKKLKELKAAYKKMESMTELNKKIRSLSEEIDALKAESDEVHEQLQEKAEESQEFHEKVIAKSKSIDALKEEEDAAYQKFSDLKDTYNEKRDALSALIDQADEIREKLGEHADDIARIDRKKSKATIKRKAEEVEEKVKKKQKLTTEDLLAFQANE